MRFEVPGVGMRPPGMVEASQVVAIWVMVLMVGLPSTLNTQTRVIVDRTKMTPCKFNPFCLCSNNGEKFKLRLEKYRKRWGNLISAVFNIINNIIKFSHFNSIQNKVRLQAGSTSNWTN